MVQVQPSCAPRARPACFGLVWTLVSPREVHRPVCLRGVGPCCPRVPLDSAAPGGLAVRAPEGPTRSPHPIHSCDLRIPPGDRMAHILTHWHVKLREIPVFHAGNCSISELRTVFRCVSLLHLPTFLFINDKLWNPS